MLKILYVSSTAHLGGGEVSLLNMLKGLDKRYFLPLAVAPSKGVLLDRLKAQNIEVKVIELMEFSRKHWLSFLFSVFKLAAIIKREKIKLVHANSIYIAEQSFFAAKLVGVPCICHVRDLVPVLGAGKLRSFAFKKMQRLIAISEAVKKDLVEKLHIPENKVIRIYNGVNTQEFSPDICGDKFRSEFNLGSKKLVGMIGRFSPEKGQETFLKTAAAVVKQYSEVNFIIVGDAKLGSETFRDEMVSLSKKLGLQDNVIFTGFRDDLALVLAALDILVVPSQAEPFGRVIIEAFACGTPVIASNSGATSELISDKCGILFTPNNVKELAGQIECLLRNNLEAQSMAKAAREVVEKNFSIENHVYAIEKLYREIIDKKKKDYCRDLSAFAEDHGHARG
ncbi:MAG: glycosyltransferase family 4 protein [Candidatus Omnitrophota bacterium]|nr:glycosyltransferase family 4 protein [Candidatus Omnitrophota bacterium]